MTENSAQLTADAKELLSPDAPHLGPDRLDAARTVLAGALDDVFLYCVPMLAVAVLCALLLTELPLRTEVPSESRS